MNRKKSKIIGIGILIILSPIVVLDNNSYAQIIGPAVKAMFSAFEAKYPDTLQVKGLVTDSLGNPLKDVDNISISISILKFDTLDIILWSNKFVNLSHMRGFFELRLSIEDSLLYKDNYLNVSASINGAPERIISRQKIAYYTINKVPKILYGVSAGGAPSKTSIVIKELENAYVAFNTPRRMKVNEEREIILLISPNEGSKVLKSYLRDIVLDTTLANYLLIDSLDVSARMEAQLTIDGVTIKPITPVSQLILVKKVTIWEWSIVPFENGYKKMYITLNAHITYNDETITQTIKTFRNNVQIYDNPISTFWKWIDKYLGVLSGLLGILLGAFVSHWFTIQREKKNTDNKPKIILPNISD